MDIRRAGITVLLCLGWLLAAPFPMAGQAGGPLDYEVKAAFLYNFARFVEWPAEAFDKADSPFVIGVLGDNPFDGTLDEAVRGKVIDNRPVRVRYSRTLSDLEGVHVLYIETPDTRRLSLILNELEGRPVLTVSEARHFTAAGGMIRFFIRNRRVAFEINKEAADRAGLRVSSRLLNVAEIYRE